MNPSESSAETPPHRRRVRYSGRNPRRFADKYKEHNPSLYPDDIAKVVASGKTPAGSHRPIMVEEVLAALRSAPGKLMVDCTLGYGGHALALLKALQPGGRLIGLDVDPIELPKTVRRLQEEGFNSSFQAVQRNFAGLPQVLAEMGGLAADGVLADLGVSSMQIDNPERGFTFKADGALDLRLNPTRGSSAADWIARASERDWAFILSEYADEPRPKEMAQTLAAAQKANPIVRTRQLVEAVRHASGSRTARGGTVDDITVRRVFQALRIAVNDEMGALDAFLRHLPQTLAPGGRAAILTFHSGEDRRVKHAFRDGMRSGVYSAISEEVQVAGPEERRANPRSAPAKLRWAERAPN